MAELGSTSVTVGLDMDRFREDCVVARKLLEGLQPRIILAEDDLRRIIREECEKALARNDHRFPEGWIAPDDSAAIVVAEVVARYVERLNANGVPAEMTTRLASEFQHTYLMSIGLAS